MLESHLASSGLLGLNDTEANLRMKPADVAWPLRERNSLEISTRVEGTKHVQVGSGDGGWQKRRDIVAKHFEPVLDALEKAEEDQFRAELAEGVSPRPITGWSRVDEEIAGLRARFRT